MSKYGNKKVTVDGIKFDSIKEAARYSELILFQRAGLIKDLKLQPTFTLIEKYSINGRNERAVKYKADFEYYDIENEKRVVEDVKGFRTKEYIIKKKLFESKFGIEIKEV